MRKWGKFLHVSFYFLMVFYSKRAAWKVFLVVAAAAVVLRKEIINKINWQYEFNFSLYFKFSLKFNIIVISIYHKHIIYVLHNFFLLSFSSDDQFATFSHCSNKSKKNVMKNIFQTRHKKRKFFNNKKKRWRREIRRRFKDFF